MNEIKKWSLECRAKDAVEVLNKRKFDAHYADTAEDAKKMVEKMLPEGAEIAVGGSVTLQKTGILDLSINLLTALRISRGKRNFINIVWVSCQMCL